MHEFSPEHKRGVYEAIYRRRDIRAFLPTPIPAHILARILDAAHHAGSVGFMQPWRFLVIDNVAVKQSIHEHVSSEIIGASEAYEGERREKYLSLKLEGILEAPVNVCVVCDTERKDPAVLGRQTIRETDIYSTCGAIQNLWLAARAEGIGVGWVSILRPEYVVKKLNLPDHMMPVAYLCLGYVKEFPQRPTLEAAEWESRRKLSSLVYGNVWGSPAPKSLIDALEMLAQEAYSPSDSFSI